MYSSSVEEINTILSDFCVNCSYNHVAESICILCKRSVLSCTCMY